MIDLTETAEDKHREFIKDSIEKIENHAKLGNFDIQLFGSYNEIRALSNLLKQYKYDSEIDNAINGNAIIFIQWHTKL